MTYKQKDEAAKLIEKQASDARMVAKEYKRAAKVTKDEACVTRPGGKFLCVRPWWIVLRWMYIVIEIIDGTEYDEYEMKIKLMDPTQRNLNKMNKKSNKLLL